MKKIIVFIFFVVFITIFGENEDKPMFKDINRDHWAYKAVQNLIYKDVISVDSSTFNGDESISRYDMALYLSKVLNKIEDEKASADDLNIIAKLVQDFSKELNGYGLNIQQYINKIKALEENKAKMEENNNSLKNEIDKINKRLGENSLNGNTKVTIDNKLGSFFANKPSNLGVSLKSALISKSSTNEFKDIKESSLLDNFEQEYEIGMEWIDKNYEIKVLKEIKLSNTLLNQDRIDIEAMLKKELYNDINLNFHTKGYRKDYFSFYNNVKYKNYHDSDGVALEGNNFGISFEKPKSDIIYNVTTTVAISTAVTTSTAIKSLALVYTTNSAISSRDIKEFDMILRADYEYTNFTSVYNFGNKSFDYEAVVKYPFLKKFMVSAGYAKVENNDVNIKEGDYGVERYNFINGKLSYKNDDIFGIDVGYEKKISNDTTGTAINIYDKMYTQLQYNVIKDFVPALRINFYNTTDGSYLNYAFLVKFSNETLGKLKAVVLAEFNNAIEEDMKSSTFIARKVNKIMFKGMYSFMDNLVFNLGYMVYEDTDVVYDVAVPKDLFYSEASYNYDKELRFFIKYLKNSYIYDNEMNFNNEYYDIDFEQKNYYNYLGIDKNNNLRGYENGILKAGFELNF